MGFWPGFQLSIATGRTIWIASFFALAEMDHVDAKPEPDAVEPVNHVYPMQSFARAAPPVAWRSHRSNSPFVLQKARQIRISLWGSPFGHQSSSKNLRACTSRWRVACCLHGDCFLIAGSTGIAQRISTGIARRISADRVTAAVGAVIGLRKL